jgi:hypothetical protein
MPLSPLRTGIFKGLNLYLRYSRCNFRPVKVKFLSRGQPFFSAYHTSISFFNMPPLKICRPGPRGPCVNTGLCCLMAKIVWWWWSVNELMAWYWQGKTKVLWEKSDLEPLGSPLHDCHSECAVPHCYVAKVCEHQCNALFCVTFYAFLQTSWLYKLRSNLASVLRSTYTCEQAFSRVK